MAEKKFAEKVFGVEEHSAAAIDHEQLLKYRNVAKKMYRTRVLRPKEMMFPAMSQFSVTLLEGINGYQKVFFVNVFKLDMTYVVAILTLISIYDVLNNPLMGIAYDKTRTRWGKARPYMIFSPIPFYIATAILYSGALFINNDNTKDPKKVIFVFLILFLQETFSTIFNIPRGNLASLMTPNPTDRITMGVLTNYSGYIGGQLVYSIFMPLQDLNRWGVTNVSMASLFSFFGIIVFAIGSAANIAMALGVKERIILQPKPAPVGKALFYILKNKYAFRNFLADFSTTWFSNGGYNWDLITQLEIVGGAFLTQFLYLPWTILNYLSISFVPFFIKLFKGKMRNGLILFRTIDLTRAALQYFVGARFIGKSRLWFNVSYALFMAINAADNAPAKVMEDEVGREIQDYTEYVTGERPDGTFGLLTELIKKLTAPLNAMMTIWMFKWSGYDATQPMLPFQQGSAEIYKRVYFLMVLFGSLPNIVKTIPYFFYDLVGEKREKMYIELNERRALIAQQKKDDLPEELEEILYAIDGSAGE
ncbi:MAG: MFS transporter [Oscillospiraceae bacterium]|jgi:Na+/melibiose symporter-like transporter|nr:MFS transporter [Oscillospiraceae bacterium]